MKKNIVHISFYSLLTFIFILLSIVNVNALNKSEYYIEENITILNTNETRATNTRIAEKTTTIKNKAGSALWYVKVQGTYSYTGSSSTCTNSIAYAGSYVPSNWKIANKSSWKSGNTAYAKATADYYAAGMYIESMTETVSLTCDAKGNVY